MIQSRTKTSLSQTAKRLQCCSWDLLQVLRGEALIWNSNTVSMAVGGDNELHRAVEELLCVKYRTHSKTAAEPHTLLYHNTTRTPVPQHHTLLYHNITHSCTTTSHTLLYHNITHTPVLQHHTHSCTTTSHTLL